MDDLWSRIKQFERKTLQTEARQQPFTIEEVSDKGLTFMPLSSGIRSYSKRAKVERAYQLALTHKATKPGVLLKATTLRPTSPHNHSYLFAIFRAIGTLE
jgi:hypothetical protein